MFSVDSYVAKAEPALVKLLNEWRPRLLESHGLAKYDLKADASVVTELDGLLETAIKNTLRTLDPDVGYVGEEHGAEGSKTIFWFVDPIDGTEQYIRGMDACRVLLCLIMNNEPVYAFAYRFTTDDLFTAQKGKGTKKNGQPVKVSSRELNRAWIETAADWQQPEVVKTIVSLDANVKAVVKTREFLNVVEGYLDAYVVIGGQGQAWDYAPRALMLSEAGAKVTNIGSETYDYKKLSLIAAHPDLYDFIYNLLSPQS